MPTCRSLVVSGASAAPRSVPPYLPILLVGLTTIGSGGSRCSTGGSLPSLTSCASIGASLSLAGFGRLPYCSCSLAVEPAAAGAGAGGALGAAAAGFVAAAAGAAVGAGAVVAAGAAAGGAAGLVGSAAAGLGASAGFGASAGLAGTGVAGGGAPHAARIALAPAPADSTSSQRRVT